MQRLPERYDPSHVAASIRALWTERSMPPSAGSTGPREGPALRQFLGAISEAEPPLEMLARLIAGDVRARYDALCGQRTVGMTLVRDPTPDSIVEARRAMIERAGAWTSSGTPERLRTDEGAPRLQEMIDVLAVSGTIVRRDGPLRSCPTCRMPRSPEEIVYQSDRGPVYLVRFPIAGRTPSESLVVWIDALWKLLGTSAVLVDPKETYALVRLVRRGTEERILLARSSQPRWKEWFASSELEVLEERPGSALVGTSYVHPLESEALAVPELPPPAGTVLPSDELAPSGTGLVALVPDHGGADAAAARALHVDGWNVLTADGRVSWARGHKYGGLPIDVAEAFLLRDLTDAGGILTETSVRRGVPYCALCGTALVWVPGRAWCFDLARLPDAAYDDFSRLLPGRPRPVLDERVPWPVSSTATSTEASDPTLRECDRCESLSPGLGPGTCACGGTLTPVRRRILPATAEVFLLWAGAPRGEAVHLFVPDRRCTPIVLEHIVAREAARMRLGDLGLARIPTFPPAEAALVERMLASPDALRASLVWASAASSRPATVFGRWQKDERHLRQFWELARRVLDGMLHVGLTNMPGPIVGRTDDLSEEDRAFLARFERTRIDVRALYDQRKVSDAQDRLLRFMEEDLRQGYVPLIRPRLDPEAPSTVQVAAYRLLGQVITQWAELYAPIAPFTMEEVVRAFRFDQASLFERGFTPINEGLLDPDREAEFAQWVGFAAALGDARRQVGLPAGAVLPKVVLIVPDDASAARLVASKAILGRLGGVSEIELDAPNQPWSGRRVDCRPVTSEIQRVHGSMAPRIARILEHMPARKVLEGVRAGTLSLTIEGGTVPVLPSMVQFAESLPECVVPVPWSGIEILVVDPHGTAESALPALTLDGFRIVRHVRRRLRRKPAEASVDRVLVASSGDLAVELAHHGPAIAQHLGVAHWEVVADPQSIEESERSSGRTRRGLPWWVGIPGLPAPSRRPKRHSGIVRTPRVRLPPASEVGTPDMFDEAHLARANAVETIVEDLGKELGRPVIGPAKADQAWEVGLRSVEDYATATVERLSPIPGFGPMVAAEVVGHFHGTAPSPARRARAAMQMPRWSADEGAPSAPSPRTGLLPGPSTPGSPSEGPGSPAVTESGVAGVASTPASPPASTEHEVDLERFADESPTTAPTPVEPTSPVPTPLEGSAGTGTPLLAGGSAPHELGRFRPPGLTPVPPVPPSPTPLGPAPPATAPRLEYLSPTPPAYTSDSPPPLPTPTAEPSGPEGLLLWPGPEEEPAWRSFLEAIAAGHRALCVTRLSPELRRRSIDRPDVELVWLSNTKDAPVPTIRPGNLRDLETRVLTAMIEGHVTAVFIDGIEYLALIHGMADLMLSLHVLDEVARAHHAAIQVPLNSALMDESEYAYLAGAFEHGTGS